MSVLKIKVNDTGDANIDWETINDLKLDNLSLKTGEDPTSREPIYEGVNDVIKNAAVDVYIHVNSDGTNYTSTDSNEITYTGSTLTEWFDEAYPDKSDARNKAIKGFLIEHRKVGGATYHLPYYWQVSKNDQGEDTSAWVLLNAIWG